MLTQIEEAFPSKVGNPISKDTTTGEITPSKGPNPSKPTREKAPPMSANPKEWIDYWNRHQNWIVRGVRPLDEDGKPFGSPSVEATCAHLTINRIAPAIYGAGDDRRRKFFEHAIRIFAIPDKYSRMIEVNDININTTQSFVPLVTEQQELDSLIVTAHMAANGISTIDALLFEEFAQNFIQETVAAMDPPTLSPYYPLFQQIKELVAARNTDNLPQDPDLDVDMANDGTSAT